MTCSQDVHVCLSRGGGGGGRGETSYKKGEMLVVARMVTDFCLPSGRNSHILAVNVSFGSASEEIKKTVILFWWKLTRNEITLATFRANDIIIQIMN